MKVEPLYYTKKQVCTLIGKSAATLDRWENAQPPMFPKRKVPPNAKPIMDRFGKPLRKHNCRVSYLIAEVDAWITGTWKAAA